MKREQIETYMKANHIEQIDLIYHQDDLLAIYCRLVGGKLKDFTDHVVDRKLDIWGYLKWENGKSTRIAWEE